jgi:hypothetical protein
MNLENYDIVQEGRIPLQKRVLLSWIGFTTYGVSSHVPADATGTLKLAIATHSLRPCMTRPGCCPYWIEQDGQDKDVGFLFSIRWPCHAGKMGDQSGTGQWGSAKISSCALF